MRCSWGSENTNCVALEFDLLAFHSLFPLVLMLSHLRTMLHCDKEYIKCVDVCWEESCLTRHRKRRVGHTWLQVKCSESIYSDRQTSWRGCPMTCSVAKYTCTMYTDTQNMHQSMSMQKWTASDSGSVDWTFLEKQWYAQCVSFYKALSSPGVNP